MGSSGTLVCGSLAGLVALSSACKRECDELPPGPSRRETGEGEPPRLVDAAFENGTVVQLAFSEPLAAVDAVDPEKFRLGTIVLETRSGRDVGYEYGPRRGGRPQCKRYVHYCDLALRLDECEGYGGYYGYGYDAPDEGVTRVFSLELDEDDPRMLELRIDPPLDDYLCLALEYSERQAGIHAFFSSADIPTIEDRDGEALEDIAPHWVASGNERTTRESFEALSHWLPIRCPEHF